jgi:hypothetical protein
MAVSYRRRVRDAEAAAAGVQFWVVVPVDDLRRTQTPKERQKIID